MFKKGQGWSLDQAIKIIGKKNESRIVQMAIKNGLVEVEENESLESITKKAMGVFENKVISAYKENEGRDTAADVAKSILRTRDYKTAEEQIIDNLKKYYRETGQLEDFRRKKWGWNKAINAEEVFYNEEEGYFYIIRNGKIIPITEKKTRKYSNMNEATEYDSDSSAKRYRHLYFDFL